jgi:hypothetical protein
MQRVGLQPDQARGLVKAGAKRPGRRAPIRGASQQGEPTARRLPFPPRPNEPRGARPSAYFELAKIGTVNSTKYLFWIKAKRASTNGYHACNKTRIIAGKVASSIIIVTTRLTRRWQERKLINVGKVTLERTALYNQKLAKALIIVLSANGRRPGTQKKTGQVAYAICPVAFSGAGDGSRTRVISLEG